MHCLLVLNMIMCGDGFVAVFAYGHTDPWVRLTAWGFLLVFYSNRSSKTYRFHLGARDKETDRSLNAPYYRLGHNDSALCITLLA